MLAAPGVWPAGASPAIEDIFVRVFETMRPRTPVPEIRVEFRRYASAQAKIRLESGRLLVRIADTLAPAPEEIHQALAEILLAKLYGRPVPASSRQTYRKYLNCREVRRQLELIRSLRGRKQLEDPRGAHHDLVALFEELNFRYFFGLMPRPALGWSRRASRTLLGHYDPTHNAIVLNRLLDRPEVPRLAVEYVLFHEMLHLRHPAEHRGARRCVHTPAFRAEERRFAQLQEAKLLLKRLF
jgi:hypothetical protein